MNTALKIFSGIILFLLVLMLTIPLFFKADIMRFVKQQINENVNAKVEFADLSLSFFRSFPNLSVTLNELSVVGIGEFEQDTLLYLDQFHLVADPIKVITKKELVVKEIILNRPYVNAIVLEEGIANWDIALADTSYDPATEEEPVLGDTTALEETETSGSLQLRNFEIRNARISYIDSDLDMQASLEDFNLKLSGNFSEDMTTLLLDMDIAALTVVMEGIPYLSETHTGFTAELEADMVNEKYTLKENTFFLNELLLGITGVVEMDEDEIRTDLLFSTQKADFKTLLSLVPAIYTQDFEGLEAYGNLSLVGYAKGRVKDDILPRIGMKLQVQDAGFQYPDLPKPASLIFVDMDLLYAGDFPDSTSLDISRFSINLGGNPIDFTLGVRTPESDMQFSGTLDAQVDLSTLKDVIIIEDTDMSGVMMANLSWMGRMSAIENEQYEDFNAQGTFQLRNFLYTDAALPYVVEIEDMKMLFTPRFVNLEVLKGTMGKSDFLLTGRLENFIPYALREDTLLGQLSFRSSFFDLNELIPEYEESEMDEEEPTIEENTDTTEVEPLEVPSNIHFVLDAGMDKVLYDEIEITDLKGLIRVEDGLLYMQDVTMKMLEGDMLMSGSFDTRQPMEPFADLSLAINNFDIQAAVEAMDMVQTFAPIASNTEGAFSMNFTFSTQLTPALDVVYESLSGEGVLRLSQAKVHGSETFVKLGEVLKTEEFKTLNIGSALISFIISNGRVEMEPFTTAINGMPATIYGSQGIDLTMDYTMDMTLKSDKLGAAAAGAISDLGKGLGLSVAPADLSEVDVAVKVGGTVTSPEVGVQIKSIGTAGALKEQARERVEKEVRAVVDETRERATQEAERIMRNAEAEAARIRQAGRDAAAEAKREARLQADKLVNEATNPITKRAAETAAKRLLDEADKKADGIIKEADRRADQVVASAKREAEAL